MCRPSSIIQQNCQHDDESGTVRICTKTLFFWLLLASEQMAKRKGSPLVTLWALWPGGGGSPLLAAWPGEGIWGMVIGRPILGRLRTEPNPPLVLSRPETAHACINHSLITPQIHTPKVHIR